MADITKSTAHDVLRYETNPLDVIFNPKSVAVIGATEREGSVGRTIVWNLMTNSFGARFFRSTPSAAASWGLRPIPASALFRNR